MTAPTSRRLRRCAAGEWRACVAAGKGGVRHVGVRHHRADEGAGVVDGGFALPPHAAIIGVPVRAGLHGAVLIRGLRVRPRHERAAQRIRIQVRRAVEVRERCVAAVQHRREVAADPA